MECYSKFKEDKRIQMWHDKMYRVETSDSLPLNIVALDAAISQMTAIRSIVYQYFLYLEELCGDFARDSWKDVYSLHWKELDAGSSSHFRNKTRRKNYILICHLSLFIFPFFHVTTCILKI